jgi:hypothetical protein
MASGCGGRGGTGTRAGEDVDEDEHEDEDEHQAEPRLGPNPGLATPPARRPSGLSDRVRPSQTQSNVAPVKLVGTRVQVPPVELGCSRRNTTSTASPRGGVGS